MRSPGQINIRPPAMTVSCTWALSDFGRLRQRQHNFVELIQQLTQHLAILCIQGVGSRRD
jgi:hypothetical protein